MEAVALKIRMKDAGTELSLGLGLGLPGSGCEAMGKKRGFCETQTNKTGVDLKLNLNNSKNCDDPKKDQTVSSASPLDLINNHDEADVRDTVKPPAKYVLHLFFLFCPFCVFFFFLGRGLLISA